VNRVIYLFPGQGSQYAGMGKSLAEAYPEARAIFAEADDALGFKLSALCFEGPEEELKKTEHTQPAILTASVAAWSVLRARGEQPDFVAGHSLGEYSAVVAAGGLAFGDAVRLVRMRGRFMQEAVPQGVGAMAALLKLPEGKLDAILAEAAEGEVVSAANLNSPDQVVIAGHAGAVGRAMELAKAAGAKRAVALPVSAPFHCALMKPAQEKMRAELDAVEFRDLQVTLVNNWQARPVRAAADVKQGLLEQIPNPVQWVPSLRYLAAEGVTRGFEVGPGAVLTGLMKQTEPGIEIARRGEAKDFE
jgi:[acyl-carrier-protein] S-malonyltransferase